jgi:hypothetical protein
VNDYPDVYEEILFVALERDKRLKDAKRVALREYRKWKLKQEEKKGSKRVSKDVI